MATDKLPTKSQAKVLRMAYDNFYIFVDEDCKQKRHCVSCVRKGWMRDGYDRNWRLGFKPTQTGRDALAAYESKHGEVKDA